MNLDRALTRYLLIAGYLMAGLFLAAIAFGVRGSELALFFAKAGIAAAISIPITGIGISLAILLKKGETKHATITIILLIFILLTVVWRLSA